LNSGENEQRKPAIGVCGIGSGGVLVTQLVTRAVGSSHTSPVAAETSSPWRRSAGPRKDDEMKDPFDCLAALHQLYGFIAMWKTPDFDRQEQSAREQFSKLVADDKLVETVEQCKQYVIEAIPQVDNYWLSSIAALDCKPTAGISDIGRKQITCILNEMYPALLRLHTAKAIKNGKSQTTPPGPKNKTKPLADFVKKWVYGSDREHQKKLSWVPPEWQVKTGEVVNTDNCREAYRRFYGDKLKKKRVKRVN
jgi:hypothetical protein